MIDKLSSLFQSMWINTNLSKVLLFFLFSQVRVMASPAIPTARQQPCCTPKGGSTRRPPSALWLRVSSLTPGPARQPLSLWSERRRLRRMARPLPWTSSRPRSPAQTSTLNTVSRRAGTLRPNCSTAIKFKTRPTIPCVFLSLFQCPYKTICQMSALLKMYSIESHH